MAKPSVKFHLRPLPGDVVLFKLAEVAAKAFGESKVNVQVVSNLPPELSFQDVPAQKMAEEVRIAQAIDQFKNRPYVTCTRIRIETTEQPQRSLTYEFRHDEEVVADLTVTYHNQAQGLELADLAAKHFDLTSRDVLVNDAIPEPLRQATRDRELSVQLLEEQVARLAIHGAAQQERLDAFLSDKVAELDQRYQAKESQLEEGFRTKEGVLEKRAQALAAKEAEFETRDSKFVRRDLLERIQAAITGQKEIRLSAATTRKRVVIHVLCGAVIVASATFVGFFANTLLSSQQPDWHHMVPIATGIVLFASTVIYYIKWNNAWGTEHAGAEFRNMRFSADILRASWLAELLFEWEREKGTEIPEQLIAAFSRNLFEDERLTDTEHPAEAFAKLARNVSEFDVSPKEGVHLKMKGPKAK